MAPLTTPQLFAIWVLPILFAITVHEVAHGWVAYQFGDPTARMMGRLTLNPFKHIDIVGTVIVPALLLMLGGIILGWAKPVPVNYSNLRKPRQQMALVAAAGPMVNLLMAILWAFIAKLGMAVGRDTVGIWLAYMGSAGIMINLVLMVLNLVPIPPLDGSRVVASFLSPQAANIYNRLEPWGFFIILGLLVVGILKFIIVPPVILLHGLIASLFGL